MRFLSYELFTESLNIKPKFYVSFDLNEKSLQSLKNRKMEGINGISSSKNNVPEFFTFRHMMLVMPYEATVAANNLEKIDYLNPEYMAADDLKMLHRIYQQKYGQKGSKSQVLMRIAGNVDKIFRNNTDDRNIAEIAYAWDSGGLFWRGYDNEEHFSGLQELQEYFFKVINVDYKKKMYSSDNFSMPRETTDKVLNNAIILCGMTYEDEYEWIVKNNSLVIPENSQLFISSDIYANSKSYARKDLEELMAEHGFDKMYKTYYVKYKDLNRSSVTKMRKDGENFPVKQERMQKLLKL